MSAANIAVSVSATGTAPSLFDAALDAARELVDAREAELLGQVADQTERADDLVTERARILDTLAAAQQRVAQLEAQPAAVEGSGMALGMNAHPLWPDWDVRVLDRLQAAGVRHVRADIGWSDLQPTSPDRFDGPRIPVVDKFMADCRARGIKVLAMLYKPPYWASGLGSASAPSKAGIPRDPADYGRAVAWFVDRYKADLVGVELTNEMDIATYSSSRKPADYVGLLKAAYAAAAGRGVPLVAGAATYLGLAPHLGSSNPSWLAQCYTAGLGKATHDVLGIHPYVSPSNVAPYGNATGSARKWSLVGVADVRKLQAANGDPAPLWATEFGWSSHDNAGIDSAATPWKLGVTAQQQADYLTIGYATLAGQGVEAAYWYAATNSNEADMHEKNFGVLNADLTPKPAYTALTNLLLL